MSIYTQVFRWIIEGLQHPCQDRLEVQLGGAVSFQSRRLYESFLFSFNGKSNEKWIMSVCVNQACVSGKSSCGWFKAKTDFWLTKKLGRLKWKIMKFNVVHHKVKRTTRWWVEVGKDSIPLCWSPVIFFFFSFLTHSQPHQVIHQQLSRLTRTANKQSGRQVRY